jgi:hypothetical protein
MLNHNQIAIEQIYIIKLMFNICSLNIVESRQDYFIKDLLTKKLLDVIKTEIITIGSIPTPVLNFVSRRPKWLYNLINQFLHCG